MTDNTTTIDLTEDLETVYAAVAAALAGCRSEAACLYSHDGELATLLCVRADKPLPENVPCTTCVVRVRRDDATDAVYLVDSLCNLLD